MVSKKDMQRTAPEDCQRTNYEELKELEKHRATEALVLVQKKHKLIKLEGEREIAKDHGNIEGEKNNVSMVWRP